MSKNRQFYLDWIRVLAFGILIFYHSGMFFVPWEFHFKNNEIIDWIKYPMLFFNQWRLSLLFFISGVGISFALKSRTGWQFIRERNKR
jgi:glucans biosynthesis protein C